MISKELKFMVGQMIMAGFPSPCVDDQARKLLKDYQVGNFIYFARNIQGAENQSLHSLSSEYLRSPCSTISQKRFTSISTATSAVGGKC